jgi:NADH-quinone oxidoreductase subunit C
MDTRLRRRLERALGDKLHGAVWQRADTTEIRIGPADVTDVIRTLHDSEDFRFEVLADLAGVDTGTEMWVVYHLWSPQSPDWLRVIAEGLPRDDPRVPSITFIWNGAEWAEREAYDMFGIIFEGNRDLRRIYMPPDYTSFPLRKDFYLADDAARSPGEGYRHVEQTHPPSSFGGRPVLRQLGSEQLDDPAAISAASKTGSATPGVSPLDPDADTGASIGASDA